MNNITAIMENDSFFREYTSQDAVLKYTRATAGYGISYLLDHDYKAAYLDALESLPKEVARQGIRLLEFGCGGGMNLVHLVSVLQQHGFRIAQAIGTDFSPVLIDAAKREAGQYLRKEDQNKVEFFVADNGRLAGDLTAALRKDRAELTGTFHFILGVNTIRYCHRAKTQFACARDILDLLVPGGVCVVIDMNDRFPAFRSALKSRFLMQKEAEEECYLPSLEEYAEPFERAGFDMLRKEHFCWIPHSAGPLLSGTLKILSPVLNGVVKSRAMRSLLVCRKPVRAQAATPSGPQPHALSGTR